MNNYQIGDYWHFYRMKISASTRPQVKTTKEGVPHLGVPHCRNSLINPYFIRARLAHKSGQLMVPNWPNEIESIRDNSPILRSANIVNPENAYSC